MTTFSGPTLNLEHVQAAWQGLTQHVPLGPILTEQDYTQRIQMLDSLLDAIGTTRPIPWGTCWISSPPRLKLMSVSSQPCLRRRLSKSYAI